MASVFEHTSGRTARAPRSLAPAPAALLALLALVLAAPASSALAGQYHVYACRTPSGEPAPADSWTPSTTGTEAIAQNTCSQPGGALVAGLGDKTPHTANAAGASWTFSTPATAHLVAATLWRAGMAHGETGEDATYEFWFRGAALTQTFGECLYSKHCEGAGELGQPLATANLVPEPVGDLGSLLSVNAACFTTFPSGECNGGFGDPGGYGAVVYLYAADLTLEQSAPPVASDVGGELASAQTVSSTSDVTFSASDPGSGVYQAVFTVDGKVVQSTALDDNGGHCRNVGQTTDGLAAFLYAQPCAASVSADVGLDTRLVANGEHHLVVTVTDAAGNAATVLDRSVTIDNAPPPGGPNGTNASAQATLAVGWRGNRHVRLERGYGRAETIVGRLTAPGGAPIGGAQVDVMEKLAYAGARTKAISVLRTDADGRFTLRLARGASSRTLRFEYSDELEAPPVVTKTLTLTVRAGVTLHIAPRTVSVGRSIHFSGRVRGGPIPSGGKTLVLEARSPGGKWLEFDVIDTNARGRYRAAYRFKFPGPVRYQFRAVCEHEADFPFARGSSRVAGVFER
jgi:hypothetical protein